MREKLQSVRTESGALRPDKRTARILVTGSHSKVSTELTALLVSQGYRNVRCIGREEAELTDFYAVERLFFAWRPDVVIHIAAKTATPGAHAKTPWDIFRDNLLIQTHVFEACMRTDVGKVIWLSSDSALPYYADARLLTEEDLFAAPAKAQIESYSMAKRLGVKMCEYINHQRGRLSCIALIPCNILDTPGGLMYQLVSDFLTAKGEGREELVMWGSGDLPYRFVHSRDLASAICFMLQHPMQYDRYIITPEKAITKRELAGRIADCTGYKGRIVFDESRSILPAVNASSERINREGWRCTIPLEEGIKELVGLINESLAARGTQKTE